VEAAGIRKICSTNFAAPSLASANENDLPSAFGSTEPHSKPATSREQSAEQLLRAGFYFAKNPGKFRG
jgi:hypothetical protein